MEKKITGKQIVNTLFLLLQLAASVAAAVQIKILNFLTTPLFAAVCAGLALLLALTAGLMLRAKKVRLWIARILALVLAAVMAVGTVYLHKTYSTIQEIVEEEEVQVAVIGVYVLSEDPAQSAAELADYDFGVLETMDRDNTDAALAQLETELGSQVYTYDYAAVTDLANALLDQKAEAIVLNEAYISLIEDAGAAGSEDLTTNGQQDEVQESDSQPEDETDGEAETEEGDSGTGGAVQDVSRLSDFGSKIRQIVSYEIPQDQLSELPKREKTQDNTLVFYFSGIDTRGSKKNVSRSDVNVLVIANTQTKQILMVNTPRDYYVPLSISGGTRDKLTHAGLYGVECSMETLSMLYDVDIDYYFRVNFSGFEKIIDALGGIDVYSDYNFTHEGYSFRKGNNHMSGAAALHFARDRYSFPNGDRQRGVHQMKVIQAVFEKLKSPSMLTKYGSLMDSLASAFDTNMEYEKIAELVQMQLSDNAEWNIVTYNVDGTGAMRKTYSIPNQNASVLIPDQATVDQAKELMRQVRHGKTLTQTEE